MRRTQGWLKVSVGSSLQVTAFALHTFIRYIADRLIEKIDNVVYIINHSYPIKLDICLILDVALIGKQLALLTSNMKLVLVTVLITLT